MLTKLHLVTGLGAEVREIHQLWAPSEGACGVFQSANPLGKEHWTSKGHKCPVGTQANRSSHRSSKDSIQEEARMGGPAPVHNQGQLSGGNRGGEAR